MWWRKALLLGTVGLALAGCGRTWSDTGFNQVEEAARLQGMTDEQAGCVRVQVENLIPAEQFGTESGSNKLAAIVADCEDGTPSDERSALGWWWDLVWYDLTGANPLLFVLIGWELFVGLLPVMTVISLVQLIF